MSAFSEVVLLALLATPGALVGLITVCSVLRERRACGRRLREARHWNDLLRADDEVPSPVLREHYEARLDEAIGGFGTRDYAGSPEVKREVDAYLRRRGEGVGVGRGER